MMSFEQHLAAAEPFLQHWGYGAIFLAVFVEGFGIPAPGQTMLLAGALLASRGELSIAAVLAAAAAAATLGNSVGWAIGHRGGRPLLLRFAGGERLASVERGFLRSRIALIVFGRFVDGVRQLNGLCAGAFGMAWRPFLGWNLLGAIVWTGFWGVGAYVFGRDFDVIARVFHRLRPVLAIAVPCALVLLLAWMLWRRPGSRMPG